MDRVIAEFYFFGQEWIITPWKLVGYAGVGLFTARWIVQVVASHSRGKSHFPRLFWYLSLAGSLLLLCYFTFGRNDSVGILSNLFPACIAGYNLILEGRHARRHSGSPMAPAPRDGPG
jgi:lipid-A-disaccharide synthase-like uncharacterized protein